MTIYYLKPFKLCSIIFQSLEYQLPPTAFPSTNQRLSTKCLFESGSILLKPSKCNKNENSKIKTVGRRTQKSKNGKLSSSFLSVSIVNLLGGAFEATNNFLSTHMWKEETKATEDGNCSSPRIESGCNKSLKLRTICRSCSNVIFYI